MILSFKHNFLFLKTTKTAGTSFEIALSKYLDKNDVITPISDEDEIQRKNLGFRGPQNYLSYPSGFLDLFKRKSKKGIFYNHIPASEVATVIGQDLFKRVLKVAITRNPYDMTVSRYYWSFRGDGNTSREHFRQWLRSRPSVLLTNQKITHIDSECVIDFFLRFEELEKDVNQFASNVGISPSLYSEFNSIKAKGQYRPKKATSKMMFEDFPDGLEIVNEIFREDILRFNYTVD